MITSLNTDQATNTRMLMMHDGLNEVLHVGRCEDGEKDEVRKSSALLF